VRKRTLSRLPGLFVHPVKQHEPLSLALSDSVRLVDDVSMRCSYSSVICLLAALDRHVPMNGLSQICRAG
jgi:hypothetical protein